MKKTIAVLGSTGSIGSTTLKIINHKLELKNFIAADLKQKAGNHFLTKFKNVFTKVYA